ncbi:T9SS type A sorting domain-containing protein [candidate division KSB1 bacterium]|nr:T9SS type A sorting domain-containing protein [candidate division KSB1 bacterium]
MAADENLQFQLYDCSRNKTIDMKLAKEYHFSRLNQEINSPFQILVGSSEFVERHVAEIRSQLPNEFCLFQNYPNPFNSITQIRFQLPSFQKVSLKILNVMGREVRALVNGQRAAGSYEISWDGKDNQGNEAGTGVYLCVFQAGQYFESRKVLVLK